MLEARRRLQPPAMQTNSQDSTTMPCSLAIPELNDSTTDLSTVVSQVNSERLKRVTEFLSFIENDYDRHITSLVCKDAKVLPNGVLNKSDVDSAEKRNSLPIGEVIA